MNEKRTRRRQCAGTLGECEEKNAGRNHRRTRACVSRRVGGDTTSFCAPKTDSLLPLFPIRRESPKQRKRKNGIGILRVGTPSPQRSATTTASFSSSDDHSPRNRFRVSRSRSHRPPTSRIWSMAPDFFFFRSRHHERKRPNTTHLFARRIVGPKATGARTSETGGPSPFASLLFFAPQKNAPFFSSSWSSSSSSAAAATLWRVLHAFCVALQMRDFLGGEEVKERRCS